MSAWAVVVVLTTVLGCSGLTPDGQIGPVYDRIRMALQRGPSPFAMSVTSVSTPAAVQTRRQSSTGPGDSIWNGLLIGAGIGAVGGYIWARNICGSNDEECFAIAAPAGMLGGAGIGAAVGAILDAFNR